MLPAHSNHILLLFKLEPEGCVEGSLWEKENWRRKNCCTVQYYTASSTHNGQSNYCDLFSYCLQSFLIGLEMEKKKRQGKPPFLSLMLRVPVCWCKCVLAQAGPWPCILVPTSLSVGGELAWEWVSDMHLAFQRVARPGQGPEIGTQFGPRAGWVPVCS